jgi:2-polyprenyl-3-methyl-5-hydroxy-6-metoxy-1,4-benzoquinol methylase
MQNSIPTKYQCSVCEKYSISNLIEIKDMPAHCHLLMHNQDEALALARGDIKLGFCSYCGHIFNLAFEPEKITYTGEYENSLHFSPHFQEYALTSAQHLLQRYQMHNQIIVEIGSGKGDFLELLCDLGNNQGYGFDPSYGDFEQPQVNNRLTLFRDFYSEKYASFKADLIVCRHVLEHIQQPVEFVSMVRRVIGKLKDTVVFFEVPNALYTLRELGIWDIIYEHCSYFTPSSLEYVFRQSGFQPIHIEETFNDQYLTIEAIPAPFEERNQETQTELLQTSEFANQFRTEYQKKVNAWQQRLSELAQADRKVVVWGAGSKGVTFLNVIKNSKFIQYVVDINPRKTGMFLSGAGQQICQPSFLREYQAEVVLVMNTNYVTEIKEQLVSLGLQPEILLV